MEESSPTINRNHNLFEDDVLLKRTRSKISNISFNPDGNTNNNFNKPALTRNSSNKE